MCFLLGGNRGRLKLKRVRWFVDAWVEIRRWGKGNGLDDIVQVEELPVVSLKAGNDVLQYEWDVSYFDA